MRLWHFLALLLVHATAVQAVVTAKLDRLLVRINGLEKEVKPGQRLELIRGDDLILRHGVLEGSAHAPDVINFLGYTQPGLRRWKDDDRDLVIATSHLKKSASLDKTGSLYKIQTRSGNFVHGDILVTLLSPELRQLTLDVKGAKHLLRAGETVEIEADDAIKVVDVRTNSPIVDAAVRMEFKEVKTSENRQVEMRLFYRTYPFASVYLHAVPK